MESLSETTWDVIICGTGLQQSLLALALSRSDKKTLHVDPNGYYGGPDASFSLQEADAWAAETARASSSRPCALFTSAHVSRPRPQSQPQEPTAAGGLSFPRAYALSLSPQLVHAGSGLLSQLVSSRAYRQLEFLAVGGFFIYGRASGEDEAEKEAGKEAEDDKDEKDDGARRPAPARGSLLRRIPSTREDVFSSADLSAREKRQLMKFLKLVLSYRDEAHAQQWAEHADRPLSAFLADKMGLGARLRAYIVTLTLSGDGLVSTREGLAALHRHLTSTGLFGPGFAAVYPKWGGGSEVAQVACRAGAVGGGVYMLGTGIGEVARRAPRGGDSSSGEVVEVELTDGTKVRTRLLVRGAEEVSAADASRLSRLVAVVNSPLPELFETTMEGAPAPAVAVVAFPAGSVEAEGEAQSQYPVYAIAHSSDTGECPAGQCVLYISTICTPEAKVLLERSMAALLTALRPEEKLQSLYQMYYEQASDHSGLKVAGRIVDLAPPSLSLTFDDSVLASVRQAWNTVMGEAAEEAGAEYMVFADREGVGDDDDAFD